ncbi:zinc ABC transporter substrate-binding protein [Candidatus Saccharibacteria bacterium]|nr:zinc ABC transporter substrate-binding protein [Candidatus Saccharibacteria bacterium]
MNKIIKTVLCLIIVILAAIGISLAISNSHQNSAKLSIVTTNFPSYDFARAVAGDNADIKMLIKPGTEVHNFEPTPQDIIDIKNSDLFIYTGGESDEWIADIVDDLDLEETKIVEMMEAVTLLEEEVAPGMENKELNPSGQPESDEEIEFDEHVWTSLKNSQKIVAKISAALSRIAPEKESTFEENAKNYQNELAKLDQKINEIVIRSKRNILVFGDRFPFRYLVNDYGLSYYAAFPGCSDQTEASAKTIAFLVDGVKKNNIPVVLKIELSSGKIAETIANETGAIVLTLNSAHNISQEDFDRGVTYLDIMKENVNVLEKALD